MKIETLKKLIEVEFERSTNISHFKSSVLKLIDLYESDKESNTSLPGYKGPILTNPCIYVNNLPDEVPYSEVCPCNPKNGGGGICGCVLPNKMVPNPKKYTINPNFTTTGTDIKIN